jgi:hypothetical protein
MKQPSRSFTSPGPFALERISSCARRRCAFIPLSDHPHTQ